MSATRCRSVLNVLRTDNAMMKTIMENIVGSIHDNVDIISSDQKVILYSLCKSINFTDDESVKCLPAYHELFSKFSNTHVYRTRNIEDRKITLINQKIISHKIEYSNNLFLDFLKTLSTRNFVINNRVFAFYKNFGVLSKAGGCSKNANYHGNNKKGSMATFDISKFFDSFTTSKIIDNKLFYKAYAFTLNTKYMSLVEKQMIDKAIDVNCKLFHTLMSFFMHNGCIPTGTVYSTYLSNFLFSSIDYEIIKFFKERKLSIKMSRYIDDIAISSFNAKDDNGYIININLIKELEVIINNSNFYLKYKKTKIYGTKDSKIINGISYSGEQKRCISSEYKYQLAKEVESCSGGILTDSIKGKLRYVKSINLLQYSYCLSFYFYKKQFDNANNVGTFEYRQHIQNEIINKGAFYDIYVKPIME